ncbi:MAG: hypothetical protein LBT09_14075 [Planctomycetaceae bacterium]|nr:hypothetical protein [Planctomycetaceae bacterium]
MSGTIGTSYLASVLILLVKLCCARFSGIVILSVLHLQFYRNQRPLETNLTQSTNNVQLRVANVLFV